MLQGAASLGSACRGALRFAPRPTLSGLGSHSLRSVLRVGPGACRLSRTASLSTSSPDAAPSASSELKQKPRSLLRIAAELSKARLSSLVVFTSGAGYLMAGVPASWPTFAAATIGTALAAAAAGTFNQVWETDLDAKMKRTQSRPLPAGAVSPAGATAFGACLTAASATTLLLGTNPLTAALGMGNIALYSLVYTPLKTRSELSTAVGAVVGAIPPVMGWVAATGGELLAAEPLLLGLTLFWWQLPHFYSLGHGLRRDYVRGGYAFAPATDPTGHRTAWLSLRSALALAALPFAAVATGVANPMFAVEGLALNAIFVGAAWRFYAAPSDSTARAVFRTSLWYLPVLLALLVFHSRHWAEREHEWTAVAAAESSGIVAVIAEAGSDEGEEADAAALGGERPNVSGADRLRVGVAVAADSVRSAGRALCVHETVKDTRVASVASELTLPAVAAGCPVPLVSAAAAPTAVAVAKAHVRGQCPVIAAERPVAATAEVAAAVSEAAVVELQEAGRGAIGGAAKVSAAE